ncbi:AMP-binding protein [Staphylococcus sp. NRL 16/872]|uniref:AMP-binding protein n=1 Tax=Staphylococcus sp. NRL 16/872 TaxID=2930131 RepID=UPI001FB2FA89|nr:MULTISPECIES: AMP-binding protein [unclassified Staphylococcus]MCJ1657062.1 AMP-binding protein [Staphylococcus sp. NRL 21/187]MCJ1668923.1 AMP-binding protein [Staphylococcus sp. NRL 19/737]WEN69140.1 AMP-binding protein [Staphylococcus sp. NRL 16/872]
MLEILKNIQYYTNEQPNAIALQFDDEVLTYENLHREISKAQSHFPELQVGSRVGLLSDEPMINMVYYFAIHMIGGVPCFLDTNWSTTLINELIDTYHIEYLLEADGEITITKTHATNVHYIDEQSQVKDLLHIGFTSGTTGLPKAYYRNEPSWLASYIENEKLLHHDESIFIAPGPLAHSLSLYTCIYALWSGRTFIGQQHFDAQQLMQHIQQQTQSIALFLVPTMLSQLVHIPSETKMLTSILSSGAKLSPQLFQDVTTTFPQANIIEFFGTSEASFISYNFNQTAPTDSVGQLFPNVTYQLEEQDSDQIGLLHVKSNMTFSGYVNCKVIQPQSWIETGDYAYVKDQNLYLVSRKSERLIIGGKNVYPTAVEQHVKQLDGIDEAVMIGEPHTRFGEIAVLIYMGHRELDYLSLRRYLLQTLSRYEVPSKLVKVSTMPFTNSGKVARGTLRELYLKGELEI